MVYHFTLWVVLNLSYQEVLHVVLKLEGASRVQVLVSYKSKNGFSTTRTFKRHKLKADGTSINRAGKCGAQRVIRNDKSVMGGKIEEY